MAAHLGKHGNARRGNPHRRGTGYSGTATRLAIVVAVAAAAVVVVSLGAWAFMGARNASGTDAASEQAADESAADLQDSGGVQVSADDASSEASAGTNQAADSSPAAESAQDADSSPGPDSGSGQAANEQVDASSGSQGDSTSRQNRLAQLSAQLNIQQDFRSEFDHGPKGADVQKYIVLHDTEVDASPASIVDSWDGSNNGIAAHFVVGEDGSVVQCVPLDRIAHHAGFGDAGHNERFGVTDESRDDKVGTTSIGRSYPDYGMNSYSIGIELVHVGSTGEGYPEAQLNALDDLVAYIDTYYGSESSIIDHKAWRTTNSDTSAEFAGYLKSYQQKRTHQ